MNIYRKITLGVLIVLFLGIFYFNFLLLKYSTLYSITLHRVNVLAYMAFLVFISYLYAKLEIEIEGEHGWAQNLPTWVYKPQWIIDLLGGKYPTGYHAILILLFLPAIFHIPVFFTKWSIFKECISLGSFFFFIVIEDFMWFVSNPKFGLKKFNSRNKKIWWHKKWFGPLPDFYLEGMLIALILLSVGLPYL